MRTFFPVIRLLAAGLMLAGNAAYAIVTDLNDPTDNWTDILFANNRRSDYVNDTQANKAGDIVGDEFYNQSGFYKRYDDGTSDPTGLESLAFRVRVADNRGSYMFIGMDLENGAGGPDGIIDFYIGIAYGLGSNKNQIAFYDPGTGANTSPSTSTIDSKNEIVYKAEDVDPDFFSYSSLDPVVINDGAGNTHNDSFQGGTPTSI